MINYSAFMFFMYIKYYKMHPHQYVVVAYLSRFDPHL